MLHVASNGKKKGKTGEELNDFEKTGLSGSVFLPSSRKYVTQPRRDPRGASRRREEETEGGSRRERSEQEKRMQRRDMRLLPLGVEVGRRFAFYGDVLCKRGGREGVGAAGVVGEGVVWQS